MFVKRVGGKRVASRASQSISRAANDITAYNHYSGSTAGVDINSRVIEVHGEGRPAKCARTTQPTPDSILYSGEDANTARDLNSVQDVLVSGQTCPAHSGLTHTVQFPYAGWADPIGVTKPQDRGTDRGRSDRFA